MKVINMAVSNKKAIFSTNIHTVWSIMTDVEHCTWRNDLSKTEVLNERDGQTEIDFTEDVTPKKWWMKLFVRGFLRKQQEIYISDLRKALEDAA